jgi:caspase 3
MSDFPLRLNHGAIREYELKPDNPGLVYIFNNQTFLNDGTRKEKLSLKMCEKDVIKLENLFEGMNFSVEKFIDFTAHDIRQKIMGITTCVNYTEVDSLFVFILSHGGNDELGNHQILTYDEKYVKVDEFIEPFKTVDSLKEKPKLFFVDACRGSNMMPTIERVKESELEEIEKIKPPNEQDLEDDFLIAHSTVDRYVSIYNIIEGSWFIESLCKMITKYKETKDISSIMSKVNDRMQQKEYYCCDKNKMFPTCSYKLTKCFKFPKKIQQSLSKLSFLFLHEAPDFTKCSRMIHVATSNSNSRFQLGWEIKI